VRRREERVAAQRHVSGVAVSRHEGCSQTGAVAGGKSRVMRSQRAEDARRVVAERRSRRQRARIRQKAQIFG
jgi:hypothetical protein